jgi:hypothetical protein
LASTGNFLYLKPITVIGLDRQFPQLISAFADCLRPLLPMLLFFQLTQSLDQNVAIALLASGITRLPCRIKIHLQPEGHVNCRTMFYPLDSAIPQLPCRILFFHQQNCSLPRCHVHQAGVNW